MISISVSGFRNYIDSSRSKLTKKIKISTNRNFHLSLAVVILMILLTPEVGEFYGENYEFGEEAVKALSVWFGGWITILYTPVFALTEWIMYVEDWGGMIEREMGLGWEFLWYRGFCAAQHLFWASIHIFGYKYARKQDSIVANLGIRFVTFSIAFKLHVIHNEWFGQWVSEVFFALP